MSSPPGAVRLVEIVAIGGGPVAPRLGPQPGGPASGGTPASAGAAGGGASWRPKSRQLGRCDRLRRSMPTYDAGSGLAAPRCARLEVVHAASRSAFLACPHTTAASEQP